MLGDFRSAALGRPFTFVTLAFTSTLALVTVASAAWADKKPKPKSDSSATDSAASASDGPAPSPSDSSSAGASAASDAGASGAADGGPAPSKDEAMPDTGEGSSTDVTEKEGKSYFFIGLRYRGDIIPKFVMNLFVDEGATFYSNSIGVEARHPQGRLLPHPGAHLHRVRHRRPVLFLEKNKPSSIVGNYSDVNSSLKAIYVTADLLWSTRVHKNIDFEYGVGFGLGVIFGDLVTNWVQADPNGPLALGDRAALLAVPDGGPARHRLQRPRSPELDASNKVGGYTEPSWVNGGSKPNIFPWIAHPAVRPPLQAGEADRGAPRPRLLAHRLLVRPLRRLRPREAGEEDRRSASPTRC